MNKKAQVGIRGMAFLVAAFVFFLVLFAMIEPFKEQLDSARNSTSLNCLGTDGFNVTNYEDDSNLERLTKRPTCFITGMSLVYFMGSVMIAIAVWVVKNWRKTK